MAATLDKGETLPAVPLATSPPRRAPRFNARLSAVSPRQPAQLGTAGSDDAARRRFAGPEVSDQDNSTRLGAQAATRMPIVRLTTALQADASASARTAVVAWLEAEYVSLHCSIDDMVDKAMQDV